MMSLKDNISALFPFIESRGNQNTSGKIALISARQLVYVVMATGQKEHDSKLTRSSVSSRYAAVIFLQLLQSK